MTIQNVFLFRYISHGGQEHCTQIFNLVQMAPIFQTCFETCLFWRFICKTLENFVPLQCQMREVVTPHFKDKNCEI